MAFSRGLTSEFYMAHSETPRKEHAMNNTNSVDSHDIVLFGCAIWIALWTRTILWHTDGTDIAN